MITNSFVNEKLEDAYKKEFCKKSRIFSKRLTGIILFFLLVALIGSVYYQIESTGGVYDYYAFAFKMVFIKFSFVILNYVFTLIKKFNMLEGFLLIIGVYFDITETACYLQIPYFTMA